MSQTATNRPAITSLTDPLVASSCLALRTFAPSSTMGCNADLRSDGKDIAWPSNLLIAARHARMFGNHVESWGYWYRLKKHCVRVSVTYIVVMESWDGDELIASKEWWTMVLYQFQRTGQFSPTLLKRATSLLETCLCTAFILYREYLLSFPSNRNNVYQICVSVKTNLWDSRMAWTEGTQ